MLESLFNRATGLQTNNFNEKGLQHRCFPVNIAKFLVTPILGNIFNDCFCICEIQTTNNVIYTLAEDFILNFKIYKIFFYLHSFANFSSTEFMFAFASFSHIKHFQCFVLQQPKQIKCFKGCVRYIFASLVLGLKEGTCQIKKNVFYFTSKPLSFLRKSNFRILQFQIS